MEYALDLDLAARALQRLGESFAAHLDAEAVFLQEQQREEPLTPAVEKARERLPEGD
jgi:hypothetical protein